MSLLLTLMVHLTTHSLKIKVSSWKMTGLFKRRTFSSLSATFLTSTHTHTHIPRLAVKVFYMETLRNDAHNVSFNTQPCKQDNIA